MMSAIKVSRCLKLVSARRSSYLQNVLLSTTSTCPITGTSSSKGSSPQENGSHGKYEDIPGPNIYPIVGSLQDFQKNGGNLRDTAHVYYKKYGMITKQNITGNEIIVYDPREHLKVFRAEGKFPAGMASDFWPFQVYSKTHEVSKLITDGEDWKDIRVKLQHDILSPQTAASYLPALTEVGRQASSAFGGTGDSPFDFTSRVAFDMFTASMLGKSRGMLFPETAMKEDLKFIEDSILCMRTAGDLAFSPFEGVAKSYYKSAMYQKFEKATDDVYKRSHELVTETMEDDAKKAASSSSSGNGSGTESEGSYISRLMQSGALSKKEAGFEVVGLLLAAVDTTANYMNWMILNLARNPDKQEALARELKEVLKGGDFNKEVQLPYLQAFYRETHRVTPVLSGVYRSLTEDIVLEGFLIPAGTKLTMNTDAIQRDEKLVENPDLFLPERWLASAVEARKGTASEILDHRLLSSPFSFGPRMCLGARLAELEIKVLIARLVQDWEISIPAGAPPIGMKEYLFLSPFPEPKFAMKRR